MGFQFVISGLGRQSNKRFLCPRCGKDTGMKSPRPQRATWTKTVDDPAAAWAPVMEEGMGPCSHNTLALGKILEPWSKFWRVWGKP